ncbi:MAG: ATP-binding protein [Acidiferrobacteraceae bacterium]
MNSWRHVHSLFGRLVIVMALIIAANQIAVYLFVRHVLAERRAEAAGHLFARQILFVRDLRNGGIGRGGAHTRAFTLVGGVVQGAAPSKHSLLALAQKSMQERIGPRASLRFSTGGRRALWLVWKGHRPFSLLVPIGQWGSLSVLLLYWKLATIALLAIVGAFVALRLVNRPLSSLVSAIDRRGPEGLPSSMPLTGPRELRRIAEHYNRMLADLKAVLDERELVLSGISHDLRTPLTRLRLSCELLPLAARETQAELVADIRALDAILDQFMAFARHGQEEGRSWCQINEVVTDVVERFSAPSVGLQIVTRLAPLPLAFVQPLGIRRVLENLLDNARRYAPGEVTVQTRVANNGIEMIVEDRGPGIPQTVKERIGRPFVGVRAGASGAGLGIAIVSAIVSAHDGTVRFTDRPGKGLSVIVYLPLPPNSEGAGEDAGMDADEAQM